MFQLISEYFSTYFVGRVGGSPYIVLEFNSVLGESGGRFVDEGIFAWEVVGKGVQKSFIDISGDGDHF